MLGVKGYLGIGVILFMLEGMVDYVIGSYFMFAFYNVILLIIQIIMQVLQMMLCILSTVFESPLISF